MKVLSRMAEKERYVVSPRAFAAFTTSESGISRTDQLVDTGANTDVINDRKGFSVLKPIDMKIHTIEDSGSLSVKGIGHASRPFEQAKNELT